METYNVLTAVVDLVRAESPEEALGNLEKRLKAAGFEIYDGFADLLADGHEQAFISEGES